MIQFQHVQERPEQRWSIVIQDIKTHMLLPVTNRGSAVTMDLLHVLLEKAPVIVMYHQQRDRDEYLLWFVYERTAREILAAFNANLIHYRDQILEELQNCKEIQIK